MQVGFTGTRHGMSKEQRETFRAVIKKLGITGFHHGDCVGSDLQAHNTVRKRTSAKIYVHPPLDESNRAFAKGPTFTYDATDYLVRNRNIVHRCSHLVAAVQGEEQLRSGTWSIIRYAKKIGRPVTIILPDGSLERIKGANTDSMYEIALLRKARKSA